jgi:hypothetical protein
LVTALAVMAAALSAATFSAPVPAAAAVASISFSYGVLVPGTAYSGVPGAEVNGQQITLSPASAAGEQFDLTVPEALGEYVQAVSAGSNSSDVPCQVAVYAQRWHCQPYAGATWISVQYQTARMVASEYPVLEQSFPVTVTDSTTGVQGTGYITARPSTDLVAGAPLVVTDGPTPAISVGGRTRAPANPRPPPSSLPSPVPTCRAPCRPDAPARLTRSPATPEY